MGVASLALGMRSLDQLGIRLDWDFHFLNKGQHAEPMPNQILVDAGGTLDTGVIDVHQGDTKYESLVRAVAENPHLVLNHLLHGLNSEYAAGRSPQINEITFTFCTHSGPGWDSMAALYLCDELLRHGKLPDDIHWLLDASDQIAQAKVKTGGATNRPFIIYYAIAALRETDKDQLLEGLKLIQKIIECARTGKIQTNGKNPFTEPVDNFKACFPDFSKHIDMIEEDRPLYLDDLSRADFFEAELPLQDRETENDSTHSINFQPGKVIAFQKPPESKLLRFWVRDDQGKCDLLMTPSMPDAKNPNHFRRWRISVDPDQNRFNLRRLGFLLENAETEIRGTAKKRGGAPRFESNYCDNSDPWYDGRNHNFTMVDSPRCGTDLPYEKIKSIIRSRFHGIQLQDQEAGSLVFYYFFELSDSNLRANEAIQLLAKNGFTKKKPLADLKSSFQFVQDAEIWELGIFKGESTFSAKVWASEITQHAIVELAVTKFPLSTKEQGAKPLILEELNVEIAALQSEASKLIAKIPDLLPFKNEIWGNECFRLIKLNKLNLKFRNPNRVRNVFEDMLDSDLDDHQLGRLMCDHDTSEDIIRTSKALCIIGDDYDELCPAGQDFRDACILYALFLKTGYRNFSQRVGSIVDALVADARDLKVRQNSRRQLSYLQEDYSVFLGRYEFSEGEINLNRRVQSFFQTALQEMAFEEQKIETRHEMQTTYELAAAQERRAFEKQNKTLQKILVWVGVLAIGDFLFAWLGPIESSYFNLAERGALLMTGLVSIAALVSYFIGKR